MGMKAVRSGLVGVTLLSLIGVGLLASLYGGGFLFLSLTEPIVGGSLHSAGSLLSAALGYFLVTTACGWLGWRLVRRSGI
jgi:hypothetical protein